MNVVWNRPASSDGERTLLQHAFIPQERGKFYEDKYEGNRTLCSQIFGIVNENERYIKVSEIDSEPFNETKACKVCMKAFKKLDT